MGSDFGKELTRRLIIKVVIPLILSVIFLYFFIKADTSSINSNSTNYSFNPKEISSNITVVGMEEFKTSINTKSDSIFFFCSNEDEACYDMLVALKNTNKKIKYINVLKLKNIEKDELYNYEMFKDGFYPKLIIIKNNNINYYNNYLNKEELNKIL